MNDDIKETLNGAILDQLKSLTNFESGSSEYENAVDSLSTLYKLRIEEAKLAADFSDKIDQRISEEDLRKEQIKEQDKERYFRVGVVAAEIVIPLIFYAVWMKRGFKFEETGTYTSTTFRGLFNRFKPTKK